MAATCSICLCTSSESDRSWVGLSGCGHVFHADCLEQSRAISDKCPNCRLLIRAGISSRDAEALHRNHPVRLHLDYGGAQSDDCSQLPLSPGADRKTRELAAARAECHRLEDLVERISLAKQQDCRALEDANAELAEQQKAAERSLQKARDDLHAAKRSLQQEVKNERKERQAAQVRLEQLQAQLDRHQLRTNSNLSREELGRIALRHQKARHSSSSSPDLFADAMLQRNQAYGKLLNDTQREAHRAEAKQAALQRDHDQEVARLKRQLQAEQAARQAAQRAATEARASAAQPDPLSQGAAGASEFDFVSQPLRQKGRSAAGSGRGSQPPPHATQTGRQQEAADDDDGFLELEDEEEGSHASGLQASRPVLQDVRTAAGVSAGISGMGGLPLAPRVAEPSFCGNSFRGASSGTFIRQGPDGRGGRCKVFSSSSESRSAFGQHKRPTGSQVLAPVAIKRRKGPSNRGGGALTMDHFFDPKDDQT